MIRWLSLLFVIIAGFSGWILLSGNHAKTKPASNAAILDGYMIEAHYTQYDALGQVHTHLYTPKMTHFNADNTSYFDHPQVTAFSSTRVPWTVNALQGKSIKDGDQVDLWGGVVIHQPPQPNNPETTITTTAMTVYPHRSYATTNALVTISRPDTHIEATGMEAYFKIGIFKLLSNAKGMYDPPAPQTSH